jgi:hypothetical protein
LSGSRASSRSDGGIFGQHSITSRSANDEYCADEVIELASANDRCWHFSAVPTEPRNVGYQG